MAAYTTQARQKKKIGTKEAVGKINNNQRKLKKGARRGTRRRRRHGRIAEVWPEVQNNLCGRHSPHTPPRGSKGPAATVSNPVFFFPPHHTGNKRRLLVTNFITTQRSKLQPASTAPLDDATSRPRFDLRGGVSSQNSAIRKSAKERPHSIAAIAASRTLR